MDRQREGKWREGAGGVGGPVEGDPGREVGLGCAIRQAQIQSTPRGGSF